MQLSKGIIILLCGICILCYQAWSGIQQESAVITFFDIGQGDAIHLRMPGGYDVLIDGGPDDKVIRKLSSSMPFYDRTIELVVISHLHSDHIMGLIEVFRRYDVEQVLWNEVEISNPLNQALFQEIAMSGAHVYAPTEDTRVHFSNSVSMTLMNAGMKELDDSNNMSLVVRGTFGETSVIFPGDLEKEGEQKLLAKRNHLRSDILKAGHHGSKTSTSEAFLNVVQPKTVMISCGLDNKFNHPSEETVDRLQRHGIIAQRTDEEGDIVVEIIVAR